jgi:hypothetical protein
MNGRISKVSIERLLHYADRLRMQSKIELLPSAKVKVTDKKRISSPRDRAVA